MAAWHPNKNRRKHERGFTLIEVMVAMMLLAFGLMAVALNNTQVLKTKVDTQVHARAMQFVAQQVEPLNQAITRGNESFLNSLQQVSNTSNAEFTITVKRSIDAQGNDLQLNPSSQWIPPYEVVFNVAYQKQGQSTLNFPSTHVFVPLP